MNRIMDKLKKLAAVGFLTSFIMITYGFGRNIFPMIIPDMKETFQFSYTTVGIVTALHQMAYLSFSYLAGRWSLRADSTRMVTLSVLVCGVCLMAMGIGTNFWLIGGLYVACGACAAITWVPMVSVINRLIPEKHLSKTMGLIASGTSYGVFLTGFAVPFIGGRHGWQSVWIAFGLLAILLFGLGMIALKTTPMSEANPGGPRGQAEGEALRDYKARIVWVSVIMLLTGLAFIPFQTYLIPYLREELGYSLELGGRVWNIIGFLGIISGFIIGTLADSISIRRALMINYAFIFTSALLVAWVASPLAILASGLLFGVAYFGTFGLIPVYISKVISKRHSASIFGISNLALGIGSSLGNYLGGWSQSLTQSFRWIYVAICLICIALLGLAMNLKNDKDDNG